MKRRTFLRYLSLPLLAPAGLGAATLAPKSAPAEPQVLQTSPVRGHHYHDGPKVLARLRRGHRLDLVAEPGNEYDEFAVRVEWRGAKLGYLPRERNHRVSRMLRGMDREGGPQDAAKVYAVVREIDRETIGHVQPVTVDVLA